MRILVTGSREWAEWGVVEAALRAAWVRHNPNGDPPTETTVVHGNAPGADRCADVLGPYLGFIVERHPAKAFSDPKTRNAFMVDLGADVCVAFATSWASGTGHCARLARKAGIPTVDYGVSTRIEDRP